MVVMKGLDVACVVIYLKACHVFCIDDCPVLVLFCSGLCLFAVLVECPVWVWIRFLRFVCVFCHAALRTHLCELTR